jgi:hypothetical protein
MIGTEQQHDDGEACGVPHMFAVDPQHEFRGDGDDARGDMDPRLVGAEQQAQRQSGDQRGAQIEARQMPEPRAQSLRAERAGDGKRARQRLGAEIEVRHVEREQRA